MNIPPAVRSGIRRTLLAWYDRHKRDLPWRRRSDDAYAQLVAELMLQQTRVETVLRYYEPFLHRFPTPAKLAAAHEGDVLKRWEGLGYYRRAQNLQRAAQQLVQPSAKPPTLASDLRQLPGVGDYTAAAVASIAFGERVAAVDGNVSRVLARLFAVDEDILNAKGKASIQRLAEQLIPAGRPGDFNQAWMDLGSLVCTPRSPLCGQCPLRRRCKAFAAGRVEELPVRVGNRTKRKRIELLAAVFINRGNMLVRQRPSGGIWPCLWEFPNLERADKHGIRSEPSRRQSAAAETARRIRKLARDEHVKLAERPKRIAGFRHELTHRSLCITAVMVECTPDDGDQPQDTKRNTGASPREAKRLWVSPSEFAELAFPTAHRHIFDAAVDAMLPA